MSKFDLAVQNEDFPEMHFLAVSGNLLFGSQPDEGALLKLKQSGLKKVINLRAPSEFSTSEQQSLCSQAHIEYLQIPLMDESGVNQESLRLISTEVTQSLDKGDKVLVHCASSNRVGLWFSWYAAKIAGHDTDQALMLGQSAGMTNPNLINAADQLLRG